MEKESTQEVIIIGGSYAGLSAAMALGRAGRKVLVIDSGKPCNTQTPHSHNFLTQDGQEPATIAAIALSEVLKYPTLSHLNDLVISARRIADGFELKTASGRSFKALKLLFATGVKDLMPAIKGFSECWGISVIHCPYCHGYEIAQQKTALLANGETAFHMAQVLSQWTKDLVLYTNGQVQLSEEQQQQLHLHGIPVIDTPVQEIQQEDGQLKSLLLADGQAHFFKAMYSRVSFAQHSDLPESLGCTINEQGYLVLDDKKQTSIPGVYAAGDNTTMARTVSMAVASGTLSGVAINSALTLESW
ncbi:NAD(P)/FAD-dependent oxidoreductase [Pedobacter gandavensis]|uniref:NAD(P)/FAD-dependent oxidoreductase n=1 Tax=Pedobacter gandavensis TaxID=2679963 RepID=UPI00292DC522|nr:NAD(P)/FAD-dependent oxidoreductase [Pedobacter gandavensis]